MQAQQCIREVSQGWRPSCRYNSASEGHPEAGGRGVSTLMHPRGILRLEVDISPVFWARRNNSAIMVSAGNESRFPPFSGGRRSFLATTVLTGNGAMTGSTGFSERKSGVRIAPPCLKTNRFRCGNSSSWGVIPWSRWIKVRIGSTGFSERKNRVRIASPCLKPNRFW